MAGLLRVRWSRLKLGLKKVKGPNVVDNVGKRMVCLLLAGSGMDQIVEDCNT